MRALETLENPIKSSRPWPKTPPITITSSAFITVCVIQCSHLLKKNKSPLVADLMPAGLSSLGSMRDFVIKQARQLTAEVAEKSCASTLELPISASMTTSAGTIRSLSSLDCFLRTFIGGRMQKALRDRAES